MKKSQMENLLFLNLGTPEIIIITFIGVLPLILALICLIDILKSNFKDTTTKLIWVLIVLVAPIIGSLIYLFFGKRQKIANSQQRTV